jgi:hypothetical protein
LGVNSNDKSDNINNSAFVIELFKTFGYFHDTLSDCSINAKNFALNNRPWDPTATESSFVITGTVGTDTTIKKSKNISTCLGMPLFHENRCVGKAIYGLNLETLNNDLSVISGMNTMTVKPFDICLNSDIASFTDDNPDAGVNVDPSHRFASTMYVFCNYDFLIQLKGNGVEVLGRA